MNPDVSWWPCSDQSICKRHFYYITLAIVGLRHQVRCQRARNKTTDSLWIRGSLWNVETRRSDGVLWQQAVGVEPTHVWRGGRSRPRGFGSREGATAVSWIVVTKAVVGVSGLGRRWELDGAGGKCCRGFWGVTSLVALWSSLFDLWRRVEDDLRWRLFQSKNLLWVWWHGYHQWHSVCRCWLNNIDLFQLEIDGSKMLIYIRWQTVSFEQEVTDWRFGMCDHIFVLNVWWAWSVCNVSCYVLNLCVSLASVLHPPWEWLSSWSGCSLRSAPAGSAGPESCRRCWGGESGASWERQAESSSHALWPGPQEHKIKLFKQWVEIVLYLLRIFTWLREISFHPAIITLVFPIFQLPVRCNKCWYVQVYRDEYKK